MSGIVSSLLPFLLIIAVFYFLILRPQQKRQKERAKLLESVKKGDKVIISGGIHGLVEGLDEATVLVKIADNTKIKVERSAISTIVGITPEEKK
ncbi:MAG: preprotein translocase subunit YajC [Ignavibacteriae bacterium]|nr:MAG: preprotein translocase subunit YajC [Ignavibacteriota bacterium]